MICRVEEWKNGSAVTNLVKCLAAFGSAAPWRVLSEAHAPGNVLLSLTAALQDSSHTANVLHFNLQYMSKVENREF